MKKQIQLKQLDWSKIIIYFSDLKNKESITPKEVVDYFHFRYVSGLGIDMWTSPDYIRQTMCAKKLLGLYGQKLTIDLIDIMFDNYNELMNKNFAEVRWSLGMLSSEKMGWFMEKVFKVYEYNRSTEKKDILKRLLAKDRKDWTEEEVDDFTRLIVLK